MSQQKLRPQVESSDIIELQVRVRTCSFKVGGEYRWSKLSGVSPRTINNLSKGRNLTRRSLKALADAAEVSAGWLAFGEGHAVTTQPPIILDTQNYIALRGISPTNGMLLSGRIWAAWDKGMLDRLFGYGQIVLFQITEQNLAPKFQEGDWVMVDISRTLQLQSGDYCIVVGDKVVTREIVFRDDGTVLLVQPGFGQVPSTVSTFQQGEFLKTVKVIGRIVGTVRKHR